MGATKRSLKPMPPHRMVLMKMNLKLMQSQSKVATRKILK
jgi:hypothetical protein